MRHLGKTPPFRGPHGEVVSGSIAEIAYRRLGGIDQRTMIRGESVGNPPLILLHGGPGLSETVLFRHFNAPLEENFTVVYWDQRGAGKSFDRTIPRSSMTVEQFISDLDELVDAVCTRLGKTKVAIFGHSWGSALGVLYAARFPEKVAAYVGSGQIGDAAAGESASYAFALAEAQRLGKQRALRKLRAIGPPPHTADELWTQRTTLSRLEGRMRPRALWKLGRAVLAGQESSILDLPSTMRAFQFSLGAMWSEVSRLNLIELVPALQMPVFFFLGRNDHWVPAEISVGYIDGLTAPSKRLCLVRGVRPRAVRRRARQVQCLDGGVGSTSSALRVDGTRWLTVDGEQISCGTRTRWPEGRVFHHPVQREVLGGDDPSHRDSLRFSGHGQPHTTRAASVGWGNAAANADDFAVAFTTRLPVRLPRAYAHAYKGTPDLGVAKGPGDGGSVPWVIPCPAPP